MEMKRNSLSGESQARIIAGSVVVVISFLIGWFICDQIWPSKASWRSVCDAGYWMTQYVPVTSCANGTCTTRTESHSNYICTSSHWECRKGRDGTTVCQGSAPGRTW